jgi:hypothetical protein
MEDSASAFHRLGLIARARPICGNTGILTQWRQAGDRCYLLVYNSQARRQHVALSLEAVGVVHELQLQAGTRRSTPTNLREGRLVLAAAVEPLQVRVFDIDTHVSRRSPSAPGFSRTTVKTPSPSSSGGT